MTIALKDLSEIFRLHALWLAGEEGGKKADLRGCDLRGCNLDFSCLPLWCGGSNFICDEKFIYQLAAHICTLKCDGNDAKTIQKFLIPFARKSHRADDLNIPKTEDEK